MIFIPQFVLSFQRQGVLHAFSLVESPLPALGIISIIILEVMLLGVYIFEENTSKGLKWTSAVLGGCLLALSIFLSISFGHIAENGISYNAPENFFVQKHITWDQVNEPVSLRIIYHTLSRGGGPGYHCRLIIRTSGLEAPISFRVPFSDKEERRSLPLILNILNHNHIRIITYIDRDTMDLIAKTKDKELSDIFKKVQSVSQLVITSRYDFPEKQ